MTDELFVAPSGKFKFIRSEYVADMHWINLFALGGFSYHLKIFLKQGSMELTYLSKKKIDKDTEALNLFLLK